jgi:GNAT superfamily N-acetyltransferase
MIRIRFATLDDAGLLLRLIRDLAAYERTPNAVVATEEDLCRYGFGPERHFEALLAFFDGEPAGFALFHPRFSTWVGRPGVYLEDLFVTQAARGKGIRRRRMHGQPTLLMIPERSPLSAATWSGPRQPMSPRQRG